MLNTPVQMTSSELSVDHEDLQHVSVSQNGMQVTRQGENGEGDPLDVGVGSESDDLLDEENQSENINELDMVHDNYDPYEDEFWQNDVDNDESYLNRMYKNGEFYKGENFGDIVLKPWMLFSDKEHFKGVLRDYCIQSRFGIVIEKSSPRSTATCQDFNCNWRIHSSRLPDGKTWAIKSIKNPEHICRGLDDRNPLVNISWTAEKLMDDIRANNDISGKTLNDYLWRRYGVKMATSTLYKMRAVALREINGEHDESYGFLPKYCEMGIDSALTELWPEAGRRYCCKHLVKNWKTPFPGPLMYSLFWRACNATSTFTFRMAMERIQKTNPLALVWLSKLGDQSRWTKYKFNPKICTDENKTNFVESFNATLGVDRCRSVLTLLETYESSPGEYEIKEGKSTLPVSLNNKTAFVELGKLLDYLANMH
ncbi:Phosphoenolpyruvate carboxylase [Bienertia sinuspersici]